MQEDFRFEFYRNSRFKINGAKDRVYGFDDDYLMIISVPEFEFLKCIHMEEPINSMALLEDRIVTAGQFIC